MAEVYVEQEECMGCESCVELCPAVFSMNDDGKAEAVNGINPPDCAQEAVDACPAECIHWKD
ncbi:ferredoxin [Fundidesulfovibrio butyratiphilus]